MHTVTNDTLEHINLLQSCFRFLYTYICTSAIQAIGLKGPAGPAFFCRTKGTVQDGRGKKDSVRYRERRVSEIFSKIKEMW